MYVRICFYYIHRVYGYATGAFICTHKSHQGIAKLFLEKEKLCDRCRDPLKKKDLK